MVLWEVVRGWGSGCIPPLQPAGKKKKKEKVWFISKGSEACCALNVSLHLSFSKRCFVCSPLNKPPVPPKETGSLFASVHNYQPFKTGLFSTPNNVVNLCISTRQTVLCIRPFSPPEFVEIHVRIGDCWNSSLLIASPFMQTVAVCALFKQ